MGIILDLVLVLISAIVHEVSHGIVAGWFGDPTAEEEGRISLNPLVHIDLYASILLPLFLKLAGSPIVFGAAKPVPVNFNRMRNPRLGMLFVSLAGPLSNYALATLCAIVINLGLTNAISHPILLQLALVNVILGTFNLIPIPPLDGSKLLASVLPDHIMRGILSLEQYGFVLVLIFLMLGILDRILLPVIIFFSQLFGFPLI
jgi:Zn-dependent protease